jgi:predicted transcriptional regulator YheO
MAEKAVHSITNSNLNKAVREVITNDVNEILDVLIQESIEFVGKPVSMMGKEDKIKGLRYLDEKGAFLIKKAGDRVIKFYDISKFTLYNYLEQSE